MADERTPTEGEMRPEKAQPVDMSRATVSPGLHDPKRRADWNLPESNTDPSGAYMIELNLLYKSGLRGAQAVFRLMWTQLMLYSADRKLADPVATRPRPLLISKTYFRCEMSVLEWQLLIKMDETDEAGEDKAMADLLRQSDKVSEISKAGVTRVSKAIKRLTQEYQTAAPEPGRTTGSEPPKAKPRRERVIYRLWPDFEASRQVDRSVATVKADAAARAYAATGSGIVWAVIDSGIDGHHLHFQRYRTLHHPDLVDLHRDFTTPYPDLDDELQPPDDVHADNPAWMLMKERRRAKAMRESAQAALEDACGHGTHVAGIIAGGLPERWAREPSPEKQLGAGRRVEPGVHFRVFEKTLASKEDGVEAGIEERGDVDPLRLRGVAPACRLISLKVLNENGTGSTSNIMRALEYVREELNDDPKLLRVHGVNLSLGYEFDAEMFACGQSPLCVEVDRLVRSGVVVVVAAGNTGYGKVIARERQTKVGLSNTINDPGNAALAITVGATHRDSPHTYGVSYFSSKGPTGDGRLKPDVVAPGERVTSCAAGKKLESNGGSVPDMQTPPGDDADRATSVDASGSADEPEPPRGPYKSAYIDDTGTSMAAPHVSGAVAAFLSIRREFIQQPTEVKRIFLTSATPLGRERYFEGNGLVDLMRAIQSI